MTDLSADADIRIMGEATTQKFHVDSAAARTIYKGQPLMIDQNVDATGNVVQFVDSVAVATDDVFVGIAAEGHTTVAGDSETDQASWINAYIEPTIVGFKSTVFTDGVDLGKSVLMSDSGTLSVTTLQNVRIGILHRVLDGYAWVRLVTPYICTGAGA
jgi:hypothetical protein